MTSSENGGDRVAPLADGLGVAVIALVLRVGVVAWAAGDYPPAEDGHYYHVVATRIARGLGYTWLWEDGTVTYAAHYPVGYPGLVGGLYAMFGARPVVAMLLAACLGCAAVLAVHRLAAREMGRRASLVASGLVACHPALVFYTPALMTEGVVSSALALGAWAAGFARDRAPRRWPVGALGLLMGASALLRPQTLLLAPVFGWLAAGALPVRAHVLRAVAVTALAIGVCLPWTARNCAHMDACTFVSANAGWNLLIGTSPAGDGGWAPLEEVGVPEACREVFGEASKDHCFRDAALRRIWDDPAAWVALVPAKLAQTFDYGGAPGWYLHASNPQQFDKRAKTTLGAAETLYHRLVVLAGLVAVALLPGRLRRLRVALALVALPFLFVRPAWVAHVGLVAVSLVGRGGGVGRLVPIVPVAVVLTTGVTHAVFFGAGRYAMVGYPLLCLLAGLAFDTLKRAGDTGHRGNDDHGAHRD